LATGNPFGIWHQIPRSTPWSAIKVLTNQIGNHGIVGNFHYSRNQKLTHWELKLGLANLVEPGGIVHILTKAKVTIPSFFGLIWTNYQNGLVGSGIPAKKPALDLVSG